MSREKKFTPGPWRWNGAAGVTEANGEPRDRVRVCDVWNNDPGLYLNHQDELVKANANLIAAAPELLEALEAVCQNCLKQCQDCPAPAAIKKAYGETE